MVFLTAIAVLALCFLPAPANPAAGAESSAAAPLDRRDYEHDRFPLPDGGYVAWVELLVTRDGRLGWERSCIEHDRSHRIVRRWSEPISAPGVPFVPQD